MLKFVTTTRHEKIKLERTQAMAIHQVREKHAEASIGMNMN